MAEQQFKREKVSILLKRASEYEFKDTDTEGVRLKKEKIHNKILLYGEPLYLVDKELVVIGDGIIDDHESTLESEWTVSGSTVEELLAAHKFYHSVNAPVLYNTDTASPSLDETPDFNDNSLKIADTEYVETAVKERLEIFYGSVEPTLTGNHKYPIIWIDTSSATNLHVPKVKTSATGTWGSLYATVRLTDNSCLDVTPSFNDNSLKIADTEYVETAITERLEVFYGNSEPTVTSNKKYPIIWVDTSGTQGAHVIKIKYTSSSSWTSLYDNVKLTNKPYLDATPAVGSNSELIASTKYVDRAILNGAEVYYGTTAPSSSMTFAGDNQKYPLIYIYKSTNSSGKTVETPYVFNAKGTMWNVFENLSLSGEPTATTNSTVTDKSDRIATDKFVWNAINNAVDGLDVTAVAFDADETVKSISETNGKISVTKQDIKISYDQIVDGSTYKRPLPGSNYPKMDGTAAAGTATNYSREDHVHPIDTSRAPVASPTFTGTVTLAKDPTANLQAATKQYVDNADAKKANLASPALTGTPTAPTATAGTNTTQIATTAFVTTAVANRSVVETKRNLTSGTLYVTGVTAQDGNLYYNTSGTKNSSGVRINCALGVLMGAAWNDFAEFRKCIYNKPGTVVCETGDGSLVMSGERLQAGAYIISDTYGMTVGPDGPEYQPVAVAGRVLANYTGDKSEYKPGAAVCAGPFGRIMPMTRDDIKNYPDRILGYVSEIPSYDEWNGVKVNNRIWIKVK